MLRRRSLLALGGSALLMLACSNAAVAVACPPGCIAAENAKPGTPQSVWDIQGSGSSAIQGFATDISVNVGATVGFKVDTTASTYRIDIYRLGYYGGDGARLIGTVANPAATNQPACSTDANPPVLKKQPPTR